ncbi:MAG: haloacid dehalogenase type II [Rhizobiales bacterium]|nr:haloacid dehalogenase type II [Hyphomicrobiales bacterium]
MTGRPAVYVFDAYGTLFDAHSAVARHRDAIGPAAERLSALWRERQLQYTWVRSMAHRMKPFHEVTADALDFAIASIGGLAPGLREALLSAYDSLDAYPEVPRVLAALKAAGCRLAILSNGSPRMLEAAIASSGLGDVLDAAISIDAVGIYKPDPRVYALVTAAFDCPANAVAFQSSNRWDVAGATNVGFHTTWINRFNQPDELTDMPPARVTANLEPLLADI